MNKIHCWTQKVKQVNLKEYWQNLFNFIFFFFSLAYLPLWQHSMTKSVELCRFIWKHTSNFTVTSRSLLNKLYSSVYQTDIPPFSSRANSRGRKIKDSLLDPFSLIYAYNLLLATVFINSKTSKASADMVQNKGNWENIQGWKRTVLHLFLCT